MCDTPPTLIIVHVYLVQHFIEDTVLQMMRYRTAYGSQSQSHIATDGQSVSQSVCLGHLGHLTRKFFPPQSYCFIFLGPPL
jgi:hypothetical protein